MVLLIFSKKIIRKGCFIYLDKHILNLKYVDNTGSDSYSNKFSRHFFYLLRNNENHQVLIYKINSN